MAASRGGTLLTGTRFCRASAGMRTCWGRPPSSCVAEGRAMAADVRMPPGAGRVGARLADAEPQAKTEEGADAAREEGRPGADRPEARGCADHDALAESVDERAGGDLHEGVGPRERREDESPLRRAHGEVRRHVRQETEIADRSMWLMARPSAQTAATAHRHPVLPDPGALVLPVVTMTPPRAPYSQHNQIINQY